MSNAAKKRVAVAIFDHADPLEAALTDLSTAGVDDRNICLLFRGDTLSRMVGDVETGRLAPYVDDLAVVGNYGGPEPLRGSYGRDIYWLLSRPDGAQSLGGRLGEWIPRTQSSILEQSVDSGDLLLWVCVGSTSLERAVPEILLRHSIKAVQVHEISE